ncbi:MAG: hypothetical protein K1W31_12100 [Lachnospiraceae bacterium]
MLPSNTIDIRSSSNRLIPSTICSTVRESNPVSQKSYDDLLQRVELSCLPCTCGCSGACIRYGSYRRHVKTDGRKLTLHIQRVLCRNCGRSHALLPSALVPYSQSRIITAVFSE